MKDLTGQRFGKLEAVEFRYYNENHRDCWLFRCDCGNEKIMPAASVKWGNVRSCGCLAAEHARQIHTQDISGRQFGRLTAVRPTDERDKAGSIVWECRCECGTMVRYSVNQLSRGRTLSCGCLYRETRGNCADSRKDALDSTLLSQLVASKKPRTDNSSGCTGVYFDKKSEKWCAYINFQKKRYFLGAFPEYQKSVEARKTAEKRLHDPIIRAQWDSLSESSRQKFLDYQGDGSQNLSCEKTLLK